MALESNYAQRDSQVVSSDENGECHVTLTPKSYESTLPQPTSVRTHSKIATRRETSGTLLEDDADLGFRPVVPRRRGFLVRTATGRKRRNSEEVGRKKLHLVVEIPTVSTAENFNEAMTVNKRILSDGQRDDLNCAIAEINDYGLPLKNKCGSEIGNISLIQSFNESECDLMFNSDSGPKSMILPDVFNKCLSNNNMTLSASPFDIKERLDDESPLKPCSPKIHFDTSVRYQDHNGGPPSYNVNKIKQIDATKEVRRSGKLSRPASSGKACQLKYNENKTNDDNGSYDNNCVKFDGVSNECIISLGNENTNQESNVESMNELQSQFNQSSFSKVKTVDESRPPNSQIDVIALKKYKHTYCPSKTSEILEESELSEESTEIESTDDSKKSRDSSFKFRHRYRSFDSDHEEEDEDEKEFLDDHEKKIETKAEKRFKRNTSEAKGEKDDSESGSDNSLLSRRYRKENRYNSRNNQQNLNDEDSNHNDNSRNDNTKEAGTLDDLSSIVKDDLSSTLLKPHKSGVSRVSTMETFNPHANRYVPFINITFYFNSYVLC